MPFQNNLDLGSGYNDQAFRYTLNFQPVIPIPLGKDWTLISHTILPFIQQSGVLPRVEVGKDAQVRLSPTSQTGLGDIVQSFFSSPVEPLPGGIIAGAGPVFLLSTATRDVLGAGKFG